MKSLYWLENWERETQQRWWKKLWNSKIHERQKFMIWKLAHKGLSLNQNLIQRGIQIPDVGCMHGCECMEDEIHVFFTYPFTKGLWFASP